MRVGIVTGIFPPDAGGPARYVPAVAAALAARGEVSGLVTLSDEPAHAGDAMLPYAVERIARVQPRLGRMRRTVSVVRALAARSDVLFVNGLVLESLIAARLGCRPAVVKVVGDLIWERARVQQATTLDLDTFQSAPLPPRWRALRQLQRCYMRRADAVVVPSDYLGRIVRGWGVAPQRIHRIYNAVELPPEDPGAAPQGDVVTVARLVPWKGIDRLIMLSAERGWRLRVVGDGPERARLEALARTSGAQVVFTGHVPAAGVAAEIRKARVFVLNSSYEGLPHIVLEAQAAGRPVVATAAGGTPEAIEDGVTGLLAPVGDSAALAHHVARLLADSGLARAMGERARAGIADRFAFDTMVARTRALLAAVAHG